MAASLEVLQARWDIRNYRPTGEQLALAQIPVEDFMVLPDDVCWAKLPAIRRHVHSGNDLTGWETGNYGPTTVTDMDRLFADGWPEGAAKLQDMIDAMAEKLPRVTGKRRKRRMSDDGPEVDVDRLYNGDYETMFVDFPKQLGFVPRTISLGVDFVIPAAMSAQALCWTGVQMAVTADLLERSGYRAALRLVGAGRSNASTDDWHLLDVTLKEGCDPLRLDLLALLMVPAISRRYILSAFCCTPLTYDVGRACGKATGTSFGRDKLRWQVDEFTKVFGYEAPDVMLQVVSTEAECIEAIRDTLELCGLYEEETYMEGAR